MPSIVLKDIPPKLHARLKRRAAQNHRSMNREAIVALEESMKRQTPARPVRLPRPHVARDPKTGRAILLTDEMIDQAIREGRE